MGELTFDQLLFNRPFQVMHNIGARLRVCICVDRELIQAEA